MASRDGYMLILRACDYATLMTKVTADMVRTLGTDILFLDYVGNTEVLHNGDGRQESWSCGDKV
jgi:hypothetical protein